MTTGFPAVRNPDDHVRIQGHLAFIDFHNQRPARHGHMLGSVIIPHFSWCFNDNCVSNRDTLSRGWTERSPPLFIRFNVGGGFWMATGCGKLVWARSGMIKCDVWISPGNQKRVGDIMTRSIWRDNGENLNLGWDVR